MNLFRSPRALAALLALSGSMLVLPVQAADSASPKPAIKRSPAAPKTPPAVYAAMRQVAGAGGKIVYVRRMGVNFIGDVRTARGDIIQVRVSGDGRLKSQRTV